MRNTGQSQQSMANTQILLCSWQSVNAPPRTMHRGATPPSKCQAHTMPLHKPGSCLAVGRRALHTQDYRTLCCSAGCTFKPALFTPKSGWLINWVLPVRCLSVSQQSQLPCPRTQEYGCALLTRAGTHLYTLHSTGILLTMETSCSLQGVGYTYFRQPGTMCTSSSQPQCERKTATPPAQFRIRAQPSPNAHAVVTYCKTTCPRSVSPLRNRTAKPLRNRAIRQPSKQGTMYALYTISNLPDANRKPSCEPRHDALTHPLHVSHCGS